MQESPWKCDLALDDVFHTLKSELGSLVGRSAQLEGYSNIWKKVWRRMDILPKIVEERVTGDVYELIRNDLDSRRPVKALEVEAGNGSIGFRLAREYLESEITLTDHLQSAADIMRYIQKECELPNVSITEADSHHLSFDNETYDVVIANLVLNRTNQPGELLRELARVLKKDGILYIVTANSGNALRGLAVMSNAVVPAQRCLHSYGRSILQTDAANCSLTISASHKCVPAFWLLTADPKKKRLRKFGRMVRVMGKRLDARSNRAFSELFGALTLTILHKKHG
jgi:ubiquinone/menaquinone biosynthesis C-methylase UbiE